MTHEHKPDESCEICESGVDAFLARARQNIEMYGHTIINVTAEGPADDLPFSYTVGLREAGMPELILFGVSPRDAGSILNALARVMRQRERGFSDGELVKTSDEATVPVKAVAVTTDRLVIAYTMYGTEDIRAMQILLPDPTGKFPPDCAPPYNRQPMLT